jgi:hypothetical protein
MESDHHGEESHDEEHVHGHGPNRSATKRMEVCEPTV